MDRAKTYALNEKAPVRLRDGLCFICTKISVMLVKPTQLSRFAPEILTFNSLVFPINTKKKSGGFGSVNAVQHKFYQVATVTHQDEL